MANCFDAQGLPTVCDSAYCIGPDCDSEAWVQEEIDMYVNHMVSSGHWTQDYADSLTLDDTGLYGSGFNGPGWFDWFVSPAYTENLEGLYGMGWMSDVPVGSELPGQSGQTNWTHGFEEWFMDQYNWGGVYDYWVNDWSNIPAGYDGGAPVMIDEDDAAVLASLFRPYQIGQEILLKQQYLDDVSDMQDMQTLWEDMTEEAIFATSQRAEELTEMQQDSTRIQESFDDQIAAIQNKSVLIQLEEQKKKARAAKAGKKISSSTLTAEEKQIEQQLETAFLDYNIDKNARTTKALNNITDLQNEYDNVYGANASEEGIGTAWLGYYNEKNARATAIDTATNRLHADTISQIIGMREEFEAGIYQQMAQLAQSGAFFESSLGEWTPQTNCPAGIYFYEGGNYCVDTTGSAVDCPQGCGNNI